MMQKNLRREKKEEKDIERILSENFDKSEF